MIQYAVIWSSYRTQWNLIYLAQLDGINEQIHVIPSLKSKLKSKIFADFKLWRNVHIWLFLSIISIRHTCVLIL